MRSLANRERALLEAHNIQAAVRALATLIVAEDELGAETLPSLGDLAALVRQGGLSDSLALAASERVQEVLELTHDTQEQPYDAAFVSTDRFPDALPRPCSVEWTWRSFQKWFGAVGFNSVGLCATDADRVDAVRHDRLYTTRCTREAHPFLACSADEVHRRWCDLVRAEAQSGADLHPHPLGPLVRACLEQSARPTARSRITVSAGGGRVYARRDVIVSHAALSAYSVEATFVDGKPMAVSIPDLGAAWSPALSTRSVRRGTPQDTFPELHVRLPADLRLVALRDMPAGTLPGDVLTLLALAHAVDRPLELSQHQGAALLARTRDGGFRRPRASDEKRFAQASEWLRYLHVYNPDPRRTYQWLELAHVTAQGYPWRVELGPPRWLMRARHEGRAGRYTLTAEGSVAARARVVAGERGAGGRLVTALEFVLYAAWDGASGQYGVSPWLRPVRTGGPGPVLVLPLRQIAALAGLNGDGTSALAVLRRVERAIAQLDEYWSQPGTNKTAPAGDAIEIVDRVRGARTRPASLKVRASARFVEAARQAAVGRANSGFVTVSALDWLGLNPSTICDMTRYPFPNDPVPIPE